MQTVEDFLIPAVTIDQSLTKLFQCMTLAYRLVRFLLPKIYNEISVMYSQFKANFSTMEELQRTTSTMEGQDSSQQFDLALLAHAMYKF